MQLRHLLALALLGSFSFGYSCPGIWTDFPGDPTETPYFGPVRFSRALQPAPRTIPIVNADFEQFESPFTLYLRNGGPDGSGRVSSATVTLDGRRIFDPSDFSQAVGELAAEVVVSRASELSVELLSGPFSHITIWIAARLRPGRERIGPEGGSVVSEDGNAALHVPAGAVSEVRVFSIEPLAPAGDPQAVAGTAYEFGPDAIDFALPATLAIGFDRTRVSDPELLEIRTLDQGDWIRVETSGPSDGDDALVATVTHLSPYLIADTEWDSVDLTLFETLQWISEQEQSFSLWEEPANQREFRVSETPVYFVRRDEIDTAIKAYLVNFPSPPPGAVEVRHALDGVGPVHRYDDEMTELSAGTAFDFELDLSGRPTYAMAYQPRNMDQEPLTNTAIPYTRHDVWLDTFVHEFFHHYQFHALDSDWRSLAFGDLVTTDYPVTADNLALSLLERHALLAGRNAESDADVSRVLQRVLAIRHARTELPEAAPSRCPISATARTHAQENAVPGGVGQSFTACQDGVIRSILVDVSSIDAPEAVLELQAGSDTWPGSYTQDVVLAPGENVIELEVPFPVETGVLYSFGLFPSSGSLSLWSAADSYVGGEAFFIEGSSRLGITPSPDLVFELGIEGPNYVDRMDRYQERNEGSAEYVARRLFALGGNTVYSLEKLEQLERTTWTHLQTSRDELMSTFFQGGWYHTGSTLLELTSRITGLDWRSTFPDGGSPLETLETLYGPMDPQDFEQLVDEAKQSYDWQMIVEQVDAIPPEYLDPSP